MIEKIIAMVVDQTQITLYRPDGTTIEILQGSPGVREIVDTVLPIVTAGDVAEVDVDRSSQNPYREFESVASGLVQFFRVAKKVVAPILAEIMEEIEKENSGKAAAGAIVTPMTVGSVPPNSTGSEPTQPAPAPDASRPEMRAAVDEILANAEPIASNEGAPQLNEDETVVAVVDGKAIPGVEQVAKQLSYAAKLGSTQGIERLLQRLAAVADKRMHSVQDVLRFLEKADLPIADDGSIIAYKALNSKGKNGTFVDCHTRKVQQRVGSFVCVDESLVDKNRRNECSNGLHIARRGYLQSFGGDVLTLCKIAPEDIIVVPHNDPNKVRVCGYHIIARIPGDAARKIRQDRPMTDNKEAQELLKKAIAGDHIDRIEQVKIGGQQGSNITVTPLVMDLTDKAPASTPSSNIEHTALDDERREGARSSVDPKKVSQQHVAAAQTSARVQKAKGLMDIIDLSQDDNHRKAAAEQLLAFKKSSKVSWEKLGITEGQIEEITTAAAYEPPVPPAPVVEESRSDKARRLFKGKDFVALWDLKRRAKVSWAVLGFNEAETVTINNKKPE
jgi:hypothetical protein